MKSSLPTSRVQLPTHLRALLLPAIGFLFSLSSTYGAIAAATTAASGVWPESEIGDLRVCWEQAGFSEEKAWVSAAIEREYAGKTKLHFTGWTDCSATPNAPIRLGVFDMPTHTKGLGQELAGVHYGIVLNFSFQNWNRPCQQTRQACIEGLAVHEFGHAAGLPDTLIPFHGDPQTCIGKSIDHLAAAALTLDDTSIMNYCNTQWQDAILDSDDVAAVAQLYP